MLFTINPTTYVISGTKGDSGAFSFIFDKDMSDLTACFIVKETVSTADVDAYIHKEYTFPATSAVSGDNNVFVVNILPSDTIEIPIVTDQDPPKYDDFVWGLKVYNANDYAETAIPSTGGTYPKFRMYYNISECGGV